MLRRGNLVLASFGANKNAFDLADFDVKYI